MSSNCAKMKALLRHGAHCQTRAWRLPNVSQDMGTPPDSCPSVPSAKWKVQRAEVCRFEETPSRTTNAAAQEGRQAATTVQHWSRSASGANGASIVPVNLL